MSDFISINDALPPLHGRLPVTGIEVSRLCDVRLSNGRVTQAKYYRDGQWGERGFVLHGVVAWRFAEPASVS